MYCRWVFLRDVEEKSKFFLLCKITNYTISQNIYVSFAHYLYYTLCSWIIKRFTGGMLVLTFLHTDLPKSRHTYEERCFVAHKSFFISKGLHVIPRDIIESRN